MRIIIFILFLASILGSAWLILGNENNMISIEMLNYHIDVSIILAIAFIFLFITSITLVIYFLSFLFSAPNSIKKHFQEKQNQQNLILLLNGFSHLHQDNPSNTKQLLKKITSHKDDAHLQNLKPIISLLITQLNYSLYNTNPNNEELEDSLLNLLQYEEMKLTALKGLITIRMDKHRYYDALIYAEKAFGIEPKLPWLITYLIKIYTELGLHDKAENIINKAYSYDFITKTELNSLLAKNFYDQAIYLISSSEAEKALKMLEKALKNDASFYEAVLTLSGLQEEPKLVYKYIEKAWKIKPSLELAKLMLNCSNHEVLNKRVKLLEGLINSNPEAKEGYLVLAELYLEEKMIDYSKKTMNKLLALHAPDFYTCKLMAIIEASAHSNHSIIINWLNKL